MGKMYNNIMQGLQEALDDAKGKTKLKRHTVIIEPLKEYDAQKIKKIRQNINMSQSTFAGYLGISKKTVEAWESGKNKPSGIACRMLNMLELDKTLPERFQFVKTVERKS